MKNPHKFLILVVILVISSYLIYALEVVVEIKEPSPKEKKPDVAREKPLEKEKTECEQQDGTCRCSCLERTLKNSLFVKK